MSVRYLQALLSRKARVQQEIERESCVPQPNWARVTELKKLRLSLKDRIHSLVAAGRSAKGDLRPRFV